MSVGSVGHMPGGKLEATSGPPGEVAGRRGFVNYVAALAAVGGLLFGYDTGVISGVLVLIKKPWHLSSGQQEIVTSAVLIGAIIGAALAGRAADRFGRRKVIIAAAVVFFGGSLFTGLAPALGWLITGRIIVGVAIGFASCVVPLYIAEIAPPARRGMLVSLNQLAITIGILVSYGVDRAFANVDNGWRYMFMLGVVPALILGIGMIFVPESPRWLMRHGLVDKARVVLTKIFGTTGAEAALTELRETATHERKVTLKQVLAPWLRPALIIAVGLMFLQQFTGINTVIYYAPTIFQMAGFSSAASAIAATVLVGVVNVAFTIVSLLIIDRVGRKPLMYIGFIGMACSLAVLGTAFLYQATAGPLVKWVAVGSVMVYIAFFAISLGPIAWLIASEIFPLSVRGTAVGISTLSNWFFNFIVALTFLSLIDLLSTTGAFWLYGGVAIVGVLFTRFYTPETKGVTLEQIEDHWKAGKSPVSLGKPSPSPSPSPAPAPAPLDKVA